MPDNRTLEPHQCRAARAILGWSRADLAERSGVAATTLAYFEVGKRDAYPRTLADVRQTLEAAGVIFISGDDVGGSGVRLQRSSAVAGA